MNLKFYVPVTSLSKSEKTKKLTGGQGVIGKIRGIASTPDLDRDGQRVMQEGLDISEFLTKGFLNWDHDNSRIVGYPDETNTKMTPEGLLVEGYLLDTEEGRRAWDTSIALQKSKTNRRLGFSIEGQVLKQDEEGRILKARVTNVALTATPVNPYTSWNTLVKSMTASAEGKRNVLIKESLEGVKTYCQKGLDGDAQVIESIEVLRDKLNKSESPEDIRLFLMLFKGCYGSELDNNTNGILEEIQKEKER